MFEIDVANSFAKKVNLKKFSLRKLVRFSPAEIDLILLNNETHELISYEFKINNPKKAMMQAIRNKMYCHYSYVVLPYSEALKISEQELQANSLGLICYSKRGRGFSFEKIIEPKQSDEINRKMKRIVYSKFSDSTVWSLI